MKMGEDKFNDGSTLKNSVPPERAPWLDVALSKEAIKFLWDAINHTDSHIDARKRLAGNISKSEYISDKDNWFYNNVLKELVETVFYRAWTNYYCFQIAKIAPPPKFELEQLWVNFQKQYEFNPPHFHGGDYSFVVFMKIPTHWKEQHKLPFCIHSGRPVVSDFQFLSPGPGGNVTTNNFPLSPEDEGRMLFFPARLTHQVFPFFGTEEERITVAGNIISQTK